MITSGHYSRERSFLPQFIDPGDRVADDEGNITPGEKQLSRIPVVNFLHRMVVRRYEFETTANATRDFVVASSNDRRVVGPVATASGRPVLSSGDLIGKQRLQAAIIESMSFS